jgi:putative flippase GtrA
MKNWFAKYKDILAYLVFGVLTTAVNYLVYFPCYNWLGWSAGLSNVLAWVIAVVFAFLTNKPFVFKSHDWSWKTVWPELSKFLGCRIGSGVLETAILLLCVDMLGWNGNVWKLITAVLVIVLNYIGSKFFVFKK